MNSGNVLTFPGDRRLFPPPPTAAAAVVEQQAEATSLVAKLHDRWLSTILDPETGDVIIFVAKQRKEQRDDIVNALTASRFFLNGEAFRPEIHLGLNREMGRRWFWQIHLRAGSLPRTQQVGQRLIWKCGRYQMQQLLLPPLPADE